MEPSKVLTIHIIFFSTLEHLPNKLSSSYLQYFDDIATGNWTTDLADNDALNVSNTLTSVFSKLKDLLLKSTKCVKRDLKL